MLTIKQRADLINQYMKWITDYGLSHTPDTFLEWLLVHHLINEYAIYNKDRYNTKENR